VVHDVRLEEIVVLLQHSGDSWNEPSASTGGEQIWFQIGVISDSIEIVDQEGGRIQVTEKAATSNFF